MACFNLLSYILSRRDSNSSLRLNYIIPEDLIKEILEDKDGAFFTLNNLLLNYQDMPTIYKALILIFMGATKLEEAKMIIREYRYSKDILLAYAAHLAWYCIHRDTDSYNDVIKISDKLSKRKIKNIEIPFLLRNVALLCQEIKLSIADIAEHIFKLDPNSSITSIIKLLEEIGSVEHMNRMVEYILNNVNALDIPLHTTRLIISRKMIEILRKLKEEERMKLIDNLNRKNYIYCCKFLLNMYKKIDESLKNDLLEVIAYIVYRMREILAVEINLEKHDTNNFKYKECDEISETLFEYITKNFEEKETRTRLIGLCGGNSAVKELRKLLNKRGNFDKSLVQAIFYTLDENIINDFVEIAFDLDTSWLGYVPIYDNRVCLIDSKYVYKLIDCISVNPNTIDYGTYCFFRNYAINKKEYQIINRLTGYLFSRNINIDLNDYGFILNVNTDIFVDYFEKYIERFGSEIDPKTLDNFVCYYIPFLVSKGNEKAFDILKCTIDLLKDKKKLFLSILLCNNDLSVNIIYKLSKHFDSVLNDIKIWNPRMLNKKAIIDGLIDIIKKSNGSDKIYNVLKIIAVLDKDILNDLAKQRDILSNVIGPLCFILQDKEIKSMDDIILL
ncbi:MAG: hypothetical protein NZM04_00555 [Methylacidiphilales bacterium]|nr:hypothetical protein [Candidatus Methylacidiphilales bacterium]